MEYKNEVLAILKKIKPTKDLSDVSDIVEAGYIDSFELMSLITELNSCFGINVGLEEMTPENFNSADKIAAMVSRLKG